MQNRIMAIAIGLLMLTGGGCHASQTPAAGENERASGRVETRQALPGAEETPRQAGTASTEEPFPSFGSEESPYAPEKIRTQYTQEVEGHGPLYATLNTSKGSIRCRLYEDKAPRTVDNFVGLALGLKSWRDPKTHTIVKRPFYEGLSFHRVIPGLLIQSGDPTGLGMGGPGYVFADEPVEGLSHQQAGVLSMAQSAPNQNGSQFFITDGPAPQFDGRFTIFGLCSDLDAIHSIARAEANPRSHRPVDPVVIEGVTLAREAPAP